ncbi:MAG: hypothetical protein H5U24_20090 [Thioclava marina]|uniref:hypothetical protein n=1 Tax=Thioclava marina TaxID=1915077 RepID=UPI0019929765|nr:hypothetical protein [Thioclava marina]MBC7147668.1 hypothetical protein [Thioclava marina]
MARRPKPANGQVAASTPVNAVTGARPGQGRRPAAQSERTAAQRLLSIIESGQMAQPRNTIVRNDDTVLSIPFAAAVAGVADVLPLGADLTALLEDDGHIYLDPPAQDAGAVVTLEAAMAQSSRAVSAGARLVTSDELEQIALVGAGPIRAHQRLKFSTFEPAAFSVVDFDADPNAEVPLSPIPVSDAELDREAMISRAFAFRMSRREIKTRGKGREAIAAELLWSIAQGLGRAMDATLFDALKALPANPWGLGKAAAQGVPFSALRGIVGTGATGAQAVEGGLFVAGVPAEITPDMAETLLGVWSRAGIAVDPNINVIVSRLDASGALELVCWADMQALVPDPAMFWAVT